MEVAGSFRILWKLMGRLWKLVESSIKCGCGSFSWWALMEASASTNNPVEVSMHFHALFHQLPWTNLTSMKAFTACMEEHLLRWKFRLLKLPWEWIYFHGSSWKIPGSKYTMWHNVVEWDLQRHHWIVVEIGITSNNHINIFYLILTLRPWDHWKPGFWGGRQDHLWI